MTRTLPFGSWPSPLAADALTRGITNFTDLMAGADALYALQSRPEEAGRTTLLRLTNSEPRELTPAPFNVRSRVHEYGGGSWLPTARGVVFVNFSDQNLYRVSGDGAAPPEAITSGDASERFADFCASADGRWLYAVRERHAGEGIDGSEEPINDLVAIDTDDGTVQPLHGGNDFYAAPRLAPAGDQLAFLVWDHPNMPWDATQLYTAPVSQQQLGPATLVAGGDAESVLQPHWTTAGALRYASDREGYWNLYQHSDAGEHALHSDTAEYASPPWVFGLRDCVAVGNDHLVAVRNANGVQELCRIDATSGERTTLCRKFAGYHALTVVQAGTEPLLYCLVDRADGFPSVMQFPLDGGPAETIAAAPSTPLPAAGIARAEPLTIANRRGEPTYAYFYPPSHTDVEGPDSQSPPLLVLSHGGPTAAASPGFNLRVQYYTSRGWAVVDVNYGGSTGFGRSYRERLRGQWGVVDVQDCEDVALHLARSGRVDANRLAIRGGSAGGFTTLAALAFGDTFHAGASHYGVGDLAALAADTHKFEARYIDGLAAPALWAERSPLTAVGQLNCPVIFFQGLQDRVVPPNQAEAMVAALRERGLPVAYVTFEQEGHGFRDATNIRYAASAEYQFMCTVLDIDCPDPRVPLAIDNLPS